MQDRKAARTRIQCPSVPNPAQLAALLKGIVLHALSLYPLLSPSQGSGLDLCWTQQPCSTADSLSGQIQHKGREGREEERRFNITPLRAVFEVNRRDATWNVLLSTVPTAAWRVHRTARNRASTNHPTALSALLQSISYGMSPSPHTAHLLQNIT